MNGRNIERSCTHSAEAKGNQIPINSTLYRTLKCFDSLDRVLLFHHAFLMLYAFTYKPQVKIKRFVFLLSITKKLTTIGLIRSNGSNNKLVEKTIKKREPIITFYVEINDGYTRIC